MRPRAGFFLQKLHKLPSPCGLQMLVPVPQALVPRAEEERSTAQDALVLGPMLSIRKAKSLDVHVPSLQHRPSGVLLVGAVLAGVVIRPAARHSSRAPCSLPHPQGQPATQRAACVWSTRKSLVQALGGQRDCWPP